MRLTHDHCRVTGYQLVPWLQAWRAVHGYSQTTLAYRSYLNVATIQHAEAGGRVRLATLFKLARGLETSVEALLSPPRGWLNKSDDGEIDAARFSLRRDEC